MSDDGDDARRVAIPEGLSVTFLVGPRRGLSANRNTALDEVDSEFVLFVDDDCRVGREYLTTALDAVRRAERQAGRGMVILSGSESKYGQTVVAHDQDFLGFQQRSYRSGQPLYSIVINATLFPSRLFVEERFDDRLRYGYEEVDLASRAVARGYVITSCPDARNEHLPSPESRQDYAGVVTASRLYATHKRYRWTERRRVKAATFAVVAPTHAIAAALRSGRRGPVVEALRSLRLAVRFARSYRAARTSK